MGDNSCQFQITAKLQSSDEEIKMYIIMYEELA